MGVSVTNEQVFAFYEDKENEKCTLTEKLVNAGFRQDLRTDENGDEKKWTPSKGYIHYYIKHEKKRPNYREAIPSQHWHLIKSYQELYHADPNQPFSVKCAELYFWMIEVSGVITKEELEEKYNEILAKRPEDLKDLRSHREHEFNAWRRPCLSVVKKLFDTKVAPVIVEWYQNKK